MTGKILGGFKKKITAYTLVPASGGCFELSVDGNLVYSKLATGKFPDEIEILEQLQTAKV